MMFDLASIQGVIDTVGQQNAERLFVGALTIGGMGAAWLSVRAGLAGAKVGHKAVTATAAFAGKCLTPRHSPLTLALLSALDDQHALFIGSKLKTIKLVCDFSKRDLMVGKDEVTPLLSKREARAIWQKAEAVRDNIVDTEKAEMRELLVNEITGDVV